MDRFPVTYEVMVKELEREGKLRPFGIAAGEKISTPRNYVFVDYHATLTNAALTVLARTKDGNLYASDLGRGDIAIARDGYVRTPSNCRRGRLRPNIGGVYLRMPRPSTGKERRRCTFRIVRFARRIEGFLPSGGLQSGQKLLVFGGAGHHPHRPGNLLQAVIPPSLLTDLRANGNSS